MWEQETSHHYHYLERTRGDPQAGTRALQKDLDYLRSHLPSIGCDLLGPGGLQGQRELPPASPHQGQEASCNWTDESASPSTYHALAGSSYGDAQRETGANYLLGHSC